MTKNYIILSLLILFNLLGWSSLQVSAEEMAETIVIQEIGPDYIQGTYSGEDKIIVLKGNTVIGTGKAVNNTFKVTLTQVLNGRTELSLVNEEGDVKTSTVYSPVQISKTDDHDKTVAGVAEPGAVVSATVNSQSLKLKSHDKNKGNFTFYSSGVLKYGTTFYVMSEVNGLVSVVKGSVAAAPAPAKPKVNSISNKSTYISGSAEPNSTIYITAGDHKYTAPVSSNGTFKKTGIYQVAAGTKVYVYVRADRKNAQSTTVKVTVMDKVPPKVPAVGKISNKVFKISGSTEAYSTVYVMKNGKKYKTVKANSKGKFTLNKPLHKASTKFEFYAIDKAGNKSKKSKQIVYNKKRPKKKLISAPLVRQMPELPRGCEVTSLTMMLNHAGVNANKMVLAKQVKKDLTPLTYVNGKKRFGNPNYGFVGNMYTFSKPGFGVFNGPIEKLANEYMPGRIVNLSGGSFNTVLNYVGAGKPVWIINTSWFSHVPSKYWQTWYTPQGPIRITMKEHSVLVTGYDSKYVYFNDPLDGMKNKKRLKKHFIEGWTQYGKQAISYF
ncbi:C39 family peptidase [Mesobacillus thioparans]|uniref:C39 family peptidase n=1 Tax=Mesobacillus thioparans TaxID=370439 RepID=UPI0039F061A7